jgi:hypothetical protein
MENVLKDLIQDIIDTTRENELYDGSDFNDGYRTALYAVLSNSRVKIETYGLDYSLYFGKFDPDDWLKNGKDYKFE